MPHAQAAVLPPTLREPGFFAELVPITEEDLTRYGEDFRAGKSVKQWLEKVRCDPHVAIEQHDHSIACGTEPRIRAAAETEIFRQSNERYLREAVAEEFHASIGGAVVHHYDFILRIGPEGGHYGG